MDKIQVNQDLFTKKNIINRVTDVPGGGSLTIADLVAGNVIPEGSPVSAPTDGKRTICKQAVLLAGSTTTALKVASGTHHIKAGKVVTTKEGSIAHTISGITATGGVDTLTVATAIATVAEGDFVYEAATIAAATTSAFANVPNSITKFAITAPVAGTKVWQPIDMYMRADIREGVIGADYLAYLPGILEIKY